MQEHFTAHTGYADTDDMRCVTVILVTIDTDAVNLFYFCDKIITQTIHLHDLGIKILIDLHGCLPQTCDCRYIFRTGAHTLLLAASIDQWSDLHFFIDIQETNALWSVDLVPTDG